MQFIGKKLTGNEPPRCVDGRPDPKSPQGPQMLGGSLHPLVLKAIISNSNFDASAVQVGFQKLKEKFPIGVHWGAHRHEGKSDCGFGDRLVDILQTAKDNKEEILTRLKNIYNKEGIDTDSLASSYEIIYCYDLSKIKITGEELIQWSIENGAQSESLQGDHGEKIAFVNLKTGTTLDTQDINKQGNQAFNLDLWAATEQTQALTSASTEILRDLSLILYQATEMVLVEQKGKLALPVILQK